MTTSPHVALCLLIANYRLTFSRETHVEKKRDSPVIQSFLTGVKLGEKKGGIVFVRHKSNTHLSSLSVTLADRLLAM